MTSLGKSFETHFFFELKSATKVKILDYHPTKPLLAYINSNHILSIWDWERKTCLKSFNVSAIESKDLSKAVTIKSIKFLDKDILSMQFPSDIIEPDVPFYNNSWFIAVSDHKVYFYDYFSEKTESVPPSIIDHKVPKCVELVDARNIAIGFNDGSVKIFDFATWSLSRIFKGLNHRNINYMFPFRNIGEKKARLIVSSIDGTMGCWDVDSGDLLFRFGKGGKQV